MREFGNRIRNNRQSIEDAVQMISTMIFMRQDHTHQEDFEEVREHLASTARQLASEGLPSNLLADIASRTWTRWQPVSAPSVNIIIQDIIRTHEKHNRYAKITIENRTEMFRSVLTFVNKMYKRRAFEREKR